MRYEPCVTCRRHVAVTETVCPFCGTGVVPSPRTLGSVAGRLSRAAVFAGAAACGGAQVQQSPPPPPPPDPVGVHTEHAFAQPPPPAAEGRATIYGVVLENGRPQQGINVQAHAEDGDGAWHEMQTNARGEFVFRDLPPGMYRVMAQPLYQPRRPQDGPIDRPEERVELQPNANLRVDLTLVPPPPYVRDTGPCCKPYGAPPARRRVV